MSKQHNRQDHAQVTTGIMLIVLGLVFFAGRISPDLAAMLSLRRLWPVLLLAFGVSRLMMPDRERHGARASGVWMIFSAVLFLLHTHLVLSLRQSWPLFLVGFGLSLIVAGRLHREAGSHTAAEEPHAQ